MRVEKDEFYGGIKILDGDKVYHIMAEIVYERDHGHGGELYISDVELTVVED